MATGLSSIATSTGSNRLNSITHRALFSAERLASELARGQLTGTTSPGLLKPHDISEAQDGANPDQAMEASTRFVVLSVKDLPRSCQHRHSGVCGHVQLALLTG
jgi:hypothetical protein